MASDFTIKGNVYVIQEYRDGIDWTDPDCVHEQELLHICDTKEDALEFLKTYTPEYVFKSSKDYDDKMMETELKEWKMFPDIREIFDDNFDKYYAHYKTKTEIVTSRIYDPFGEDKLKITTTNDMIYTYIIQEWGVIKKNK